MNFCSILGRLKAAFLFSVLFLFVANDASAQIDPTLDMLRNVTAAEGLKSPIFGPPGRGAPSGVDEHGASVLLRFETELTPTQISLLEKNGAQFERDPTPQPNPTHSTLRLAPVRHNGTIYRAYISWAALDFLANYPPLVRAEAGWSPGFFRPLEHTSAQVGAAAANILPDLGVDGQGMLIGNIDSGIDVLHPAFFHADGGLYNWIDVNENGVFDPGIDAVDLNNNGVADRNEILRVLDGAFIKDFYDPQIQNLDNLLQPRSDWLYADQNQDQQRNVGRPEGFDEQTPAYGEPLFVVDDVNGNGKLDVGEKLVRLKTSKIVKVVDNQDIYQRGQNLIDVAEAHSSRQNAHHGTGVSGILVGGQPGYHDRVGLAPAAELIIYTNQHETWQTTLPAAYIEDAISQKVDVLLHEWSECMMRSMDGGSNLEAAMDLAREAGVLQVTPAGNLNRARKNTVQTIEAGQSAELSFDIDGTFYMDDPQRPYSTAYGSIQWREGTEMPEFFVQSPGGVRQPVVFNGQPTPFGEVYTIWNYERTHRGTHFAQFYIYSSRPELPLQSGRWSIQISNILEDTVFLGRVSDNYSGWGPGISWTNSTTDQMTLCSPSTADSAIGVAAHAGRHDELERDGSRVGELRNFSGHGPRIDGRRQIALSAPDDPYAPLFGSPEMVASGWGRSWYAAFGGTSGAGPHIAASFALLRQHHPDWTPEQLENRMYETADRDDLVPEPVEIPDIGWGWGKINIYRALYDRSAPENNPPTAILKLRNNDNLLVLDASDSSDPDGDALEYRFDINYDGNWEIDWSSDAKIEISRDLLGDLPGTIRLEVRDPDGARAGALARTDSTIETPDPENPGSDPDAGEIILSENASQTAKGPCACSMTTHSPVSPVYFMLLPAIFFIIRRRRS